MSNHSARKISAEGVVTESDYVAGQYLHLRIRLIVLVSAILVPLALLYIFFDASAWLLFGTLAYLIVWIFVAIPWIAKRNYRQYRAMAEHLTMEIRDDGIFFKQHRGEALLPWSHIVKWRHNKELVLLYPTGNIFHLVPGHFFATPADFSDFLKLLLERVGKAG